MRSIIFIFLFGFFTTQAADYYWVGGTGNWSQISHWATSSGGSTFHASAPGPNDNVYFDGNSFSANSQTLTLNVVASCKNMDWTGLNRQVTLSSNAANRLEIYGSLTLHNFLTVNLSSSVFFRGNGTKNHDFKSKTFDKSMYFISGNNILDSRVTITDTLFLLGDTLNTNDFLVKAFDFYSQGNNARLLDFGSSTIQITRWTGKFETRGNGIEFDASNGTIEFTNNLGYLRLFHTTNKKFRFKEVKYTKPYVVSTYRHYLGSRNADTIGSIRCPSSIILFGNKIICDSLFLNGTGGGRQYLLTGQDTLQIREHYDIESGHCTNPNVLYTVGTSRGVIWYLGDTLRIQDFSLNNIQGFSNTNTYYQLLEVHSENGNNINWNFSSGPSLNFYWVGGNGNWSDPTKWSFSSGGSPQSVNGCTPKAKDNVFFDGNSFNATGQYVNLTGESYCKNMDWTGALFNPVFSGAINEKMHINGDLQLIQNMSFRIGFSSFEGNGRHFVDPSDTKLEGHAEFLGGTYRLRDSLHLLYNFRIISMDSFISNSHKIFCDAVYINISDSTSTIDLGSSLVDVYDATYFATVTLFGDSLRLLAKNSRIRIRGNDARFNCYLYSPWRLRFGTVEMMHSTDTSENIFNVNYDTISHLILHGNSIVSGTNPVTDTLSFVDPDGDQEFLFNNGMNFHILDSIFSSSSQCNSASLVSTLFKANATQAKFVSPSGTISLNHAILHSIRAMGGATFYADVFSENGNNPGWNISKQNSGPYFWVGGHGNWHNPSNWSLSSGGTPLSGSDCIPGDSNDVYFDSNSFTSVGQEVAVNAMISFRGMYWQNAKFNPKIVGAGQIFNNGDIILTDSMQFDLTGDLYFVDTLSRSIRFSGNQLKDSTNIYVQNASINFIDSFSAPYRELFFSKGTLNSNGHTLKLAQFKSTYFNTRHLDFSNSKVHISRYLLILGSGFSSNFNNSIVYMGTATPWHSKTIKINTGSPVQLNKLVMHNKQQALINNSDVKINYFENLASKTIFDSQRDTIIKGHIAFDNEFREDQTFDTLNIYGQGISTTQTFYAGKSIKIEDSLGIFANGCFRMNLRSSSSSTSSLTSNSAQDIHVDFCNIENLSATGMASFNAGRNSTDVGGNSGWLFDPTAPNTLSLLVSDFCVDSGSTRVIKGIPDGQPSQFWWKKEFAANDTFNTNNDTLWAHLPRIYTFHSDYGGNCIIVDTVKIFYSDKANGIGQDYENLAQDSSWFTCANWDNFLIPDSISDVTISSNERVYIDGAEEAQCKDLIVEGTLVINGGSLEVYGNLTVNGQIISDQGLFKFMGDSSTSVNSANDVDLFRMHVEKGNAAVLDLNTKIKIKDSLSLVEGIVLTTNSDIVTILSGAKSSSGNNLSYIEGPMKKVGTDSFVFPVGNNGSWARLGITAPSSISTFRARYYNTSFSNTTSINTPLQRVSTLEYWDLSRTAGSGMCRVMLFFENATGSGIYNVDTSHLTVAHWGGASWSDYSNVQDSISGNKGFVQSDWVSNFSPFTFGANTNSNPLPVTWINVQAQWLNEDGLVEWSTSSQNNNQFFDIERSYDLQNFEYIGRLDAKQVSGIHHYQFLDESLRTTKSKVIYYRIKQVDFNGDFSYSSIALLNSTKETNLVISPNPASSIIQLDGIFESEFEIVLYNMQGLEVSRSINQKSIDISGMRKGCYFVEIKSRSQIETLRLFIN